MSIALGFRDQGSLLVSACLAVFGRPLLTLCYGCNVRLPVLPPLLLALLLYRVFTLLLLLLLVLQAWVMLLYYYDYCFFIAAATLHFYYFCYTSVSDVVHSTHVRPHSPFPSLFLFLFPSTFSTSHPPLTLSSPPLRDDRSLCDNRSPSSPYVLVASLHTNLEASKQGSFCWLSTCTSSSNLHQTKFTSCQGREPN